MFQKTLVLFTALVSFGAHAAAQVGKAAPEFTLTDTEGTTHTLKSFRGKTVVLEWLNHECPYVKKHYDAKNMQKLQKDYTAKGVVWLSVNTGAEGKQGVFAPAKANELSKEKGASPSAVLQDRDGAVGKLYGAKTTPHMYIIKADGVLAYNGAIDDNSSSDSADVATAKNYVSAALDEVLASKPVTVASSKPYGCGVKY